MASGKLGTCQDRQAVTRPERSASTAAPWGCHLFRTAIPSSRMAPLSLGDTREALNLSCTMRVFKKRV